MGQVKRVLSERTGGLECFTPCAVLGADGLWTVWQGYRRGEERIFARFCDREEMGTQEAVTPEEGLRHSPFVGLVEEAPAAVWIEGGEGHRVVYSSRSESGWGAPGSVGEGEGAVGLHAAAGGGRLWAAWCRTERPGMFSIWAAAFDGGNRGGAVRVRAQDGWMQRPAVAPAEGGCWVCWDEYDGLTFSVWAAFVGEDGSVSTPQRVSMPPATEGMVTPDAWQFAPCVCTDADGAPWVVWLCSQDVENTEGVVDQWPTARAARLGASGWAAVADGEGCADLGGLAWGLLDKHGAGVWGFLGRRRKPQVVPDPSGGVWMLWERKEVPEGSTQWTPGILCGRKLDGETVGPTLAIGKGPRWYAPAGIEEGRLWVACRVDAETSTEDVGLMVYELEGASPLEKEGPWEGWRPVVLREPRPDSRPEVEASGSLCQLYWADLHSHTGLSADAEGEVDELIAYARDKAGLDCVVLQDNDKHLLSLTSSEYETYCTYVRHFHRDGTFVMLPAFEWTCKKPNHRTRYHRTVIGRSEDLPLIRYSEVAGEPMAAITAHAEKEGAILHPHHENWELTASPAEANVEVCSGWCVHMLDPRYQYKVHELLSGGRRFGFFGSSDNHRRNPGMGGGLTGVYAEALTRDAILDALRKHRCFATDGSRIVVKFRVNGAFMGGEATVSEPPEVRWEVQVTAPPATVGLIRDGVCICKWRAGDFQATGSYVDRDCRTGEHFYYLSVEQSTPWTHYPSTVAVARGPHAWSSPVWVKRTDG